MAGETDMDQLQIIFRALGSPTDQEWPVRTKSSGVHMLHLMIQPRQGMTKLPDYVKFGPFPKSNLRQLFTAAGEDALNLLQKMLTFDPLKRISAKEVRLCESASERMLC